MNPELLALKKREGEKFYVNSANSPFVLHQVDVLNARVTLKDKDGNESDLTFEDFQEWENATSAIARAAQALGERLDQHKRKLVEKYDLPENASYKEINDAQEVRITKSLERIDKEHGTRLARFKALFNQSLKVLLRNEIVDAVPESGEGKEEAQNALLYFKTLRDEWNKIFNEKNAESIQEFLEASFERLSIYFSNQNDKNHASYPETYNEWEAM